MTHPGQDIRRQGVVKPPPTTSPLHSWPSVVLVALGMSTLSGRSVMLHLRMYPRDRGPWRTLQDVSNRLGLNVDSLDSDTSAPMQPLRPTSAPSMAPGARQ